jgi:membrane protease YdiL (CAAX protease family)
VVVAGVAFGLAHAYQGVGGVLSTGVLGAVLAALYLGTGSLLLPVVLHAVIDLRFLLVPARVLPAAGRLAS